jgi:hypothetical protein
MKNKLLAIVLFGLTLNINAQEVSVEKSIFGIQTGLLGVWVNNEARLSKQIALRSEIGLDSGIFGGQAYEKTGFVMVPVLTLEPRWYYNLGNRNSKGKNIKNNSGNFLTLRTSYSPDWFAISNYNIETYRNQLSLIPKWGIRRNYGKHLNFETGIGIGEVFFFGKNKEYFAKNSDVTVDLHLRIGYTF